MFKNLDFNNDMLTGVLFVTGLLGFFLFVYKSIDSSVQRDHAVVLEWIKTHPDADPEDLLILDMRY